MNITVILCFAALLSFVFRLFKQPAILAYILTGIILGPMGLFQLDDHITLSTLGQFGITFLLFMLGLELKIRDLASTGKAFVITGVLQMWFSFVLGFFLALFLGIDKTASILVGLGLAYSSTIIAVKLLSDKKELTSLHGKLSIGILLVQDFFAIMALIFLSGMANITAGNIFSYIGLLVLKIVLLFSAVFYLSEHVFPKVTKVIARSPESLFLFSLAWVFAFTAIVTYLGFSIEIGGFLAGLALANAHENFQIIARMKALRDFFITIFFVTLGLQMKLNDMTVVLWPALILSLFVLFVQPLLVMVLVSILGYRKRTAFMVGLSIGQISEFSLILLFLGKNLNLISDRNVTLMVMVAIITFTISTYLIQNGNKIYRKLSPYLEFLHTRWIGQDSHPAAIDEFSDLKDHIVLVGADRVGLSLLSSVKRAKEKLLVIDFNPDIVEKIRGMGILAFFGDIADPEIQERAKFNKARLVVSTVPDPEVNMLLMEGLHHVNRQAKFIVTAFDREDAKELYEAGADYVVMPHLAGGRHLAKILKEEEDSKVIEGYREKDMEYLG